MVKLQRQSYGKILIAFSFVPLAFLIYTLLNLESLGITIFHPRVVVEAVLFASFLSIGAILSFK